MSELRLVITRDWVEVGVLISHKGTYNLVKIKQCSRKQIRRLDGIGVRRIIRSDFLEIVFLTTSLML